MRESDTKCTVPQFCSYLLPEKEIWYSTQKTDYNWQAASCEKCISNLQNVSEITFSFSTLRIFCLTSVALSVVQ